MGVLFAIILLDASLIGANAIGLATTYAVGDAMGRRHSLHWKITEAPLFYGGYAVLLAVFRRRSRSARTTSWAW